MKLWLVRHAQPLIDKGVCYGQLDVEADREATQQCARSLAGVLPPNLPVYVSELRRARQLADELLALRSDLSLTVDPRLNEMNFGIWEGVPWNDIPVEDIDRWTLDFAHYRFGAMESTTDVLQRVGKVLHDMSDLDEAVWITHAGVIRAVDYFIRHGDRVIQSAGEWPTQTLEFGAWTRISVSM